MFLNDFIFLAFPKKTKFLIGFSPACSGPLKTLFSASSWKILLFKKKSEGNPTSGGRDITPRKSVRGAKTPELHAKSTAKRPDW